MAGTAIAATTRLAAGLLVSTFVVELRLVAWAAFLLAIDFLSIAIVILRVLFEPYRTQ